MTWTVRQYVKWIDGRMARFVRQLSCTVSLTLWESLAKPRRLVWFIIPANLIPRTVVSCLYWMCVICFALSHGPNDNFCWYRFLHFCMSWWFPLLLYVILVSNDDCYIIHLYSHWDFLLHGSNVIRLTSRSRESGAFKAAFPTSREKCSSRQRYFAREERQKKLSKLTSCLFVDTYTTLLISFVKIC